MTRADYSRHKDRDPLETVGAIRATLDAIGIRTELTWTSRQFDSTYANHVSIAGTALGANGKGTTREYAMASGYAELMERIQNRMIGHRAHAGASFASHGFYDFPDERLVPAREVLERRDALVDGWLSGWGMRGDDERLRFLEGLSARHYGRSDGMLVEVPLVDAFAHELRWLPLAMCRALYKSNGMSSGNTLEECLVQGLSEVLERHVKAAVLKGEATPPPIPRDELAAWSVGELVDRIEEGGRYRVRVYDGSLGRGYPVVVTAIVDSFRGSFGVNVGAHPSLPVAVERTLTEAFQGRDVESFARTNSIAPSHESSAPENLLRSFMDGRGSYPASLFVGEPGWAYERWPADEGLSNAELLRRMVGLLAREGRTLLVRDTSFLGFPTCQVLVPGMSEIVPNTPEQLARDLAKHELRDAIRSFPRITADQEERLLAIEALYRDSREVMGFDPPIVDGGRGSRRLFGFLHLSRREFAAARDLFLANGRRARGPMSSYWQALARYAGWREEGVSHRDAVELVGTLYHRACAERVARETEPGPDLLSRVFPQMSCYDCEGCAFAAAKGCSAVADAAAFERIGAAMARSHVTQEGVARLLRETLAGS